MMLRGNGSPGRARGEQNGVNRFSEMVSARWLPVPAEQDWAPEIDLVDRPQELVLEVDLPGVERESIEVTGSVGVGLEEGHRHWVLNTLGQYGARLLDRTLVDAIESDGAVRVWRDGKGETLGPFDTIVLAAGYRSNDELYRQIQTIVPEVYLIGDAVRPRSAVEAILEAATRARAI